MIPIRDDNPQVLTPYATFTIVALNVLSWIVLQGWGSDPALLRSVCIHGLMPGELLHTLSAGAQIQIGERALCVIGTSANWLSVISHMFLHGSWAHLVGNLWFLWIFGGNVEDSMGHARFLGFYLLCGLAAAMLQILSSPLSGVPMVGASGAIGGVMGAYILLYPRVNVQLLFWFGFYVSTYAVPAFWMLGYWFLVQVLGGLSSLGAHSGGIAFWAHVGGFAAGAVLVLMFRDPELVARHPYHGWRRRSPGGFHRLD
jgi:membrane associated rhomboid family serine protease